MTKQRDELYQMIVKVNAHSFTATALALFQFQAKYNPVYATYLSLLGTDVSKIQSLEQIPCLPIELFKNHDVRTGEWTEERIFTSSGTTGTIPSRHFLRDGDWYIANAVEGFERFYGKVETYCTLALLPHYLDRQGSSLVYMAQAFIQRSKYKESGFFLRDTEALLKQLEICRKQKIPTLLIGVSFALLDLAENHPTDLSQVVIMETGGMKGQRKELIREELHETLMKAFQQTSIHSEYGMTELLSQAYSKGGGRFFPSKRMHVIAKEIQDPFCTQSIGQTGQLQIIDLANLDTCAFIRTEDLGRVFEDGSFEILGRLDNAALRGCNLMVLD